MPLRQVQIPTSCLQIGMPQQNLNSTQIRAGFEQVGCEAMPYGVRVNSFVEAGPLGRLPHRVVE